MMKFFIPHRREGEKIIILLRRHIFIIFYKIIFWAIAALLPLIFYIIFSEVLSDLINNQYVKPIVVLFISIYYLYIWLFSFHSFVDYYLDVWIVTSDRIINIEQKGLFARTVSEQKLYRIQDVTSELKGFFSTALDYGNVFIQTAAEEPRFIFKQIPKPNQVAKKINKMVEQKRKYERMMERKDRISTR